MKEKSLIRRICGGMDAFAPHLLLTFSVMAMTFCFINLVNDAMGFLTAGISIWFQLLYYVLSVLTALVCLIADRVRILSVLTMVLGAVLFVPAVISLAKQNTELISMPLYQNSLLAFSFLTLLLAIVDIVVIRKKAMAEYRAAAAASDGEKEAANA